MEIVDKLKIKPLTTAQILISIDRLTRFKFTEEKYLRVFKDIIISNLVYPKYKKKQLDLMAYDLLANLASRVFNDSLMTLGFKLSLDNSINIKLLEYEKSIFNIDENVQKLLENHIDFNSAVKFIEGDNLALNLKWLKSLSLNTNQRQSRTINKTKFPLEKIIITEGITEEILLPKFAKLCGYDFDEYGVHLVAAGGKNQVVKLFYQLINELQIPIFILLDNDARENLSEIAPKLRKSDKVHVIHNGEFEDILPRTLIKKTLNNYLKNFASVNLDELSCDMPMTKILADIFKQKGFNEFKKAEFAQLVSENILCESDVSAEIATIINEITSL